MPPEPSPTLPMNLATRCLQCGTVFRVGQDQLVASEGWVRCGRCQSVFDATEVLFDADSGAPMRLARPADGRQDAGWQADDPDDAPSMARAPQPPVSAPSPTAGVYRAPPDPVFPPPDPDAPFESLLRAPSRPVADEPPEPIVITDHVPAPAPVQQRDAAPAWPGRTGPPPAAPALASVAEAMPQTIEAAAPSTGPVAVLQPTPSFLRRADAVRRARHPLLRAGLWAAVVLLALALPLQAALLWRDTLAAQWPRAAPALQALCGLAGCSVQPLRRIQQIAVTSSGLNRIEGSNLYRLQLVLQNRADTPLRMPAFDLALTDPQGQLVARRVLGAADLGQPQAALQAGQEIPIKVLLSAGEQRIAGYTVELFYP